MLDVRRTDEFSQWLSALRDTRAKGKILVRIDRLARGNPGDVAPVGEGVSELRINYGPGYRVYYVQRGTRYILLLAGGDKGTQDSDIAEAKRLATEYQE
jgi:putative addiction module killer protein